LIGVDGEATTNGIHFSDLGMTRYVERTLPATLYMMRLGKFKKTARPLVNGLAIFTFVVTT
jgi:hypothetical protein